MANEKRLPFEPYGVMSAVEACRQIIERIPAKDGITYDQAVDDVAELCEYRHTEAFVCQAMYEASESLLREGVPGMIANREGRRYWVRMDDVDALRHAQMQKRKELRANIRAGRAAGAADPEKLSWEQRNERDNILRTTRRASELEQRREAKRRRLPSAASTAQRGELA